MGGYLQVGVCIKAGDLQHPRTTLQDKHIRYIFILKQHSSLVSFLEATYNYLFLICCAVTFGAFFILAFLHPYIRENTKEVVSIRKHYFGA